MRASTLALFLACTLPACSAADPADLTPDEIELTDDAKTDSVAEVSVRAGLTTLWIDRALPASGGRFWLMGRTSRELTDGRGFVFDDPYGEYEALGKKSFRLGYSNTDIASLVHGVNQFIGLSFKPSAGRPDHLTARVVVRPRLHTFSGSGASLTAELTPVISGGRTVYRIKATAPSKIYGLQVDAAGVNLTDVKKLDDTHFQVDLLLDHLIDLVQNRGDLTVKVRLLSGQQTKRCKLQLAVKSLGLTDGDAYDKWPAPTCTATAKACLAALPAGTVDLGSCGEAIKVQQCQGQLGVTVDDVAIQAALKALDARVTDPAGFAKDAIGLVGADKALELVGAVNELVGERLQNQFGKWYPTAAARDAAMSAELEAGIDHAYARPFTIIEPHAPIPGDLAQARHVAADALLGYLATLDLVNTEFGRPLEEMARTYRAQHVQSVRDFRETATTYGTTDIYLGGWLGAHVEIEVSKVTGKLVNIYFEID
jgi:hypothetical protein